MASAKDLSGSCEEPTPGTEADPPNNSNVNLDDGSNRDKQGSPARDTEIKDHGSNAVAVTISQQKQPDNEDGAVEGVVGAEDVLSNRISVVYFTVGDGDLHETALVPMDAPPDDIKG